MQVKQILDNEIYLLIKYIKSLVWRVAKCLSYIQNARCLEVKPLKDIYIEEENALPLRHPNTSITKSCFEKLFTPAWSRKRKLATERLNSPNERKRCKTTKWRGVFQVDSSKKEKRWMLLLTAVGFVKWSGDWIKFRVCGKVVGRSMSWSTRASFTENIWDRICPCWLSQ